MFVGERIRIKKERDGERATQSGQPNCRARLWHSSGSILGMSSVFFPLGILVQNDLFLFCSCQNLFHTTWYSSGPTNPNSSSSSGIISYVRCCEYDWGSGIEWRMEVNSGPIRLCFLLVSHRACLHRDLIYPSVGTRDVKTHRAMHHTVNEIW